jgi:hypothetical protein
MIVGVNISVIIREKEEAKTQRRLLMVKTKSDVERILDKIDGEKECAIKSNMGIKIDEIVFKDILTSDTPEILLEKIIQRVYNTGYYSGKTKLANDFKTWIQENILGK